MKRSSMISTLLFFTLLLCPRPVVAASPSSGDALGAAESVNAFAFDLYRQLAKDEKGNVFFSPQNISSAFAMLYAGAADETERELSDVFRFGDSTDADMKALQEIINATSPDVAVVEGASAIWPDKNLTLRDSYVEKMRLYYDSEVVAVNYSEDPAQAAERINHWASLKTHGRIPKIIDSIDRRTRLVLTSAIYFKSAWPVEFSKSRTKEQPFFRSDGSETKVELMNRQDWLAYYESEHFQAIKLYYKGHVYSMLVMLPKERGKLKELEATLSLGTFKHTLGSLREKRVDVILYIPKFTFRTQYELDTALRDMGLKQSFTDDAQFPRLAEEPLKANRVIHKTFIEVDEKKTEAAAVTGLSMMITSSGREMTKPKIFRADHPFLFFILENRTNTILFMGRYVGPE